MTLTTVAGQIAAETLRPGSPTVQWPPVPDLAGALVLGVLRQIEAANTLPADTLAARQQDQLERLTDFAHKSTQHYRNVLAQAARGKVNRSDFWSFWRTIPTVSTADLNKNRLRFTAGKLPKQHGAVTARRVGMPDGSTLRLKTTPIPDLIEKTIQITMMRACGWEFDGKLAMSGDAKIASPRISPHWGMPFKTGPMLRMPADASAAVWRERLGAFRPDYLVLPASKFALLRPLLEGADRPDGLKEVLVVGAASHEITEVEGLRVRRFVTLTGVGAIAAERPDGGEYQLQPAATLCELLAAGGEPVAPGVAGRVVLTPLHNFAMPILRLDLGITATQTSAPGAPGPATIAFS
ncbi:MAG: hypothetical protein MI755_17795 [Sphingomonadales bacterium]|nr:hypothetical protein [Sphingomonadales bacterium]